MEESVRSKHKEEAWREMTLERDGEEHAEGLAGQGLGFQSLFYEQSKTTKVIQLGEGHNQLCIFLKITKTAVRRKLRREHE